MKLWLLKRPEDEAGYDENAGFVIRAESEQAARNVAEKHAEDYGDEDWKLKYREEDWPDAISVWQDPERSTCIELSADGPEEIILIDFLAA